MKNLTETSVFTATVSVPEGGDPRTAASVESAFQALADRTRNLLDRLAALETYCLCTIANGSYSGGTYAPLTIVAQSGGFTVSGGNRLVPPSAGKYLFQASIGATSTSTTNPIFLDLFIDHASALRRIGRAPRLSGSPADPLIGGGSYVADIDVTNDRVGLYWDVVNPTIASATFVPQILMRRID